jgi:hypothetical protein
MGRFEIEIELRVAIAIAIVAAIQAADGRYGTDNAIYGRSWLYS